MLKPAPVAEYMKIRRYVMNQIHKAQGKSVQIPTSVTLAKKFGVSRQTVSKAMKELTRDGYIIGKPGLGSFTNPSKEEVSPGMSRLPIIGVLISDGMCVHFNKYLGKMYASIINELVDYPAIAHTLNVNTSEPDAIYKDIMSEGVNGIIWANPRSFQHEVTRRLNGSGVTTVTAGILVEGVNGVRFDYEKMGYEYGKILIEEGRNNIVYLADLPPWNLPANGLKRAYKEAGIKLNENLFIAERNMILERFKTAVGLGIPVDAVFNPLYLHSDVLDILKDANMAKECWHLCSDITVTQKAGFHGILHHFDFTAKAREAVKLLRLQMEKPGRMATHTKIPLKISIVK